MKYQLSLLFIFLFSISFAQSITLKELLILKNKVKAKEYLTDKNWKIMHEHYEEELKFGDIRFSLDNENPDRQVPIYIEFHYEGKDLTKNRIIFEMSNKEKFDEYMTQLISLGFKLVDSKSDVNKTTEIFKDKTTTIEATIMPVENYYEKQKTLYKFYITDNNFVQTEYKF